MLGVPSLTYISCFIEKDCIVFSRATERNLSGLQFLLGPFLSPFKCQFGSWAPFWSPGLGRIYPLHSLSEAWIGARWLHFSFFGDFLGDRVVTAMSQGQHQTVDQLLRFEIFVNICSLYANLYPLPTV